MLFLQNLNIWKRDFSSLSLYGSLFNHIKAKRSLSFLKIFLCFYLIAFDLKNSFKENVCLIISSHYNLFATRHWFHGRYFFSRNRGPGREGDGFGWFQFYPLLTFYCVAGLLTGHRPVLVHGPGSWRPLFMVISCSIHKCG